MPSKMIDVSFDAETGGEKCGIIQQKGTMSNDEDDKVIRLYQKVSQLHYTFC